MNQLLVIDNLAFSKKNETLSGILLLADCPRLQELLHQPSLKAEKAESNAQEIAFDLTGTTNSLNQHFLSLSITAKLSANCQRCLSAMPLILKLHFNYLISDVEDADLEALALDNVDDYDLLQSNANMDLAALIEDELIMALPIAPTHENTCVELITQSGEKPNPFAALKGLIKPQKSE